MGPDHKSLLESYATKLETLLPIAQREFDQEVAAARAAGAADPESVARKRRGPPAAHPRILAVIRECYFACQRLNEQKEATGIDEYVEPIDMVFSDLETKKYYQLWESLAELVYFPIGTDRDGRSV
jgi:hypothetical protein